MISSVRRKLVSFDLSYDGFSFPQLDSFVTSAPIAGYTTSYSTVLVFDDDGNEVGIETVTTQIPYFDEDWEFEPPSVLLWRDTENNREYYSIHGDYTEDNVNQDLFVPSEDSVDRYEGDLAAVNEISESDRFTLRFEDGDSLGSDFTEKVLLANQDIRDKYLKDNDYAYNIGLCTCTETAHNHVCHFMHEVDGCVECTDSTDPDDNVNFSLGASPLPSPAEE